ncbi:MAG TPA: glutamate-5-semialdehyde dehydrogenase [Blastocatellia bacterium]|nr:glutamate-5-semialdehyde dehydrogenase [Blastocatellia bacterium]
MQSAKTDNTQAVIEAAKKAKAASGALARFSTEEKNHALRNIARRLNERAEEILAANRQDLDAARPLVESGRMAESLYRRLKLDEAKLRDMISGIEQVAALADPVGGITLATELDEGLRLYRVNCPIGVVGVIFESRPDALTQIASLCLKSANAVLLKGGREAENSNRVLFATAQSAAVEAGVPAEAMTLLESREDVRALLEAEGYVDLIIPRGSNALVSFVQENTNIPVLGHAEGICHVYVDRAADLEKALEITLDAKAQYPAACNAIETLLVHAAVAREFLPRVIAALQSKGVEVRCDDRAMREYGIVDVKQATQEDWSTEYSDLILAVKVVDSLEEAIEHINTYGSRHTDAIITEDDSAWERFFAEVDSAGVYLNASTRFADGYRYGFGAEVGISTGKLHPRGPVGLEGLVTYKYKLVGSGQTVAMYSGSNARKFTHRVIDDQM